MESNNSKFGLGIFIGLLIALVIGLCFFIAYDKVLNNNPNDNTNDNKNTQNEQKEEMIKKLDLSNSLVQSLYKSVELGMPYNEISYVYYKGENLLANDLDNNIKMYLTGNNWLRKYNSGFIDKNSVEKDEYGNFYLSEQEFKESYYEIFGKSSIYKFEDSKNTCPIIQKEANGNIKIWMQCGGTGPLTIKKILTDAEKTENEIYIYEKVAFFKYESSNSNYEFSYKMYKDTNKSIFIAENVDYSVDLTKYQDKLDTYKYTFKSNGDGTYYFYSVERQ